MMTPQTVNEPRMSVIGFPFILSICWVMMIERTTVWRLAVRLEWISCFRQSVPFAEMGRRRWMNKTLVLYFALLLTLLSSLPCLLIIGFFLPPMGFWFSHPLTLVFFPLCSPARFRSFLVPLPIPCFPCTLLFPFPYFPPFQSPFPSCSIESERKKENDCQSFFLWRSGSAFCTSSNCTKSPSDVPSSDDDGMAAGAVAVAVADERDGRNHGQQCEANRLLIHLPVSAKISHSLSPFFMAGDDVIHESVEFEIFDTTRILLSRG